MSRKPSKPIAFAHRDPAWKRKQVDREIERAYAGKADEMLAEIADLLDLPPPDTLRPR